VSARGGGGGEGEGVRHWRCLCSNYWTTIISLLRGGDVDGVFSDPETLWKDRLLIQVSNIVFIVLMVHNSLSTLILVGLELKLLV
jgi:hypothetical protein